MLRLEAGGADQPRGAERSGLTLRALLVATVGVVLSGYWMRATELYGHAVQISESVPVIPAVALLCLFLPLNPLLARLHPRLALTRAEVLVAFSILSLTPLLGSIGLMRMLLPAMVCANYYATPENHLETVWDRLPHWFGPRDPELIKNAFLGHQPGVPWGPWLPGLLLWGAFLAAMYVVLLSLCAIFRRQWTERERLTFPLMQIVQELAPAAGGGSASMLRSHLFWIGVALPVLYNVVQMVHAFFPTFPSLGRSWDIGKAIESRPWIAMRPLDIPYRPELVSLCYLMSTEVTFSIWSTYLMMRFSRVAATALGFVDPYSPFPYDQSQAMGVYIALVLVALYLGRGVLREVWLHTLGRPSTNDSAEPMSYRLAFIGLFGGLAFIFYVVLKAGMGWPLALLYFFLVFAVAVVYTRIRAETGAPMVWLFPFWQQEKLIYSTFGSSPFLVGGDARPLVVLAFFTWLSRGYYPNSVMSVQLESFRLADDSGTPRRHMTWALVYAFVLGLVVAVWIHLSVYYDIGCDYAEGGGRAKLQNMGYLTVAQILTGQPLRPNHGEAGAALAGFVLALGMLAARIRVVGFPFHPLGYAMAASYGHPLWGQALMVWVFKVAVLKAGGIRLFRRYIPFFMGLLIGHFFAAGVVWGIVAVFRPDVTYNYVVYFG
ncbi:MAG: hypothetical protein HYU66_03790 [Armatimonadetes bacterium]|nr:hypothetical protein [Armatimonadota bacterium]